MKALLDEIDSRLQECMPDNKRETALGLLQWESCRTSLLNGNCVVIFRRPGGFPETHVIRRRKKG
jgi:hypothetical protein